MKVHNTIIVILTITLSLSLSATARAVESISLGAADTFVILAGDTIANTGSSSITGDIGVVPGDSIKGFSSATVTGTLHSADATAVEAKNDLDVAYNVLVGQPSITTETELGSTTKTPGVYHSDSGALSITGSLVLDALDDPNAVFIFKADSILTTSSESEVILINGAQACNIFWQVGSSAILGANSMFKGNIIASDSVTLTTGTNVEGRILAKTGSVTMDTNTIMRATCAPAPTSTSPTVLYIPLIGITSVPDTLTLPNGPGNVTYNYSVKNFLKEAELRDVKVVDDHCAPVRFVTGDEDNDVKLDYNETWRYACTTKVSETSVSMATATGTGSEKNITATHSAHAMVVVGSNAIPPLVSIVNVTRLQYPLSVASHNITYTYRVTNPGTLALGGVTVTDDKCSPMSGKLGDTNANNLLDINEVWIYNCSLIPRETTTHTVTVTGYANGVKASDYANFTVIVSPDSTSLTPDLPNMGGNTPLKIIVWTILSGILVTLIIFSISRKKR